jgi:hypothetical protein
LFQQNDFLQLLKLGVYLLGAKCIRFLSITATKLAIPSLPGGACGAGGDCNVLNLPAWLLYW